jgi:hypothetical protein
MTPTELEIAAYAAAHKIYVGLPAPDRPCPGGYRSRYIDEIADTIKECLSVHVRLEGQAVTGQESRLGGRSSRLNDAKTT